MATRIPLKLCLFYLIEAYHVWKKWYWRRWRRQQQTFGKIEHKNLVMFAIKCAVYQCLCMRECGIVSMCEANVSWKRAKSREQEMHAHNTSKKSLFRIIFGCHRFAFTFVRIRFTTHTQTNTWGERKTQKSRKLTWNSWFVLVAHNVDYIL